MMISSSQIINIPKRITGKSDLVVLSRDKYEDLILLEKKAISRRQREEADTDKAIASYLREKKAGKLKRLKSLADLD